MPTRLLTILVALTACTASARADTFTATLPADAAATDAGRLLLFFIRADEADSRRRRPVDAPFYSRPQPVASVAVGPLEPGGAVTLAGDVASWPVPVDELDGEFIVQALLDTDDELSSHRAPGNRYSSPQTLTLRADRDDIASFMLTEVCTGPRLRKRENVVWVELRSEVLSAFAGRDVFHRAGVVLPIGYRQDEANGTLDRRWPTIYVIPGFGGRHWGLHNYARLLTDATAVDLFPQAVYVMLDPDSPYGHHGYVDSPNVGPRGSALVRELIPHLERELRLDPRPEARVVTGHSSGGWSSLWLQLQWPDVFGACWSSAPDPVDFSAFQNSDLYADESLFADDAGADHASYRVTLGPDRERTLMTVRAEYGVEWAMSPTGRSGQQWQAWEAMFSPRDPTRGGPAALCDPRTGAIDRAVVEHWARYDIARLVTEQWERYGPTMTHKVRLACGGNDSFFLERAVKRLKAKVDERAGEQSGDGYIWVVRFADHGSVIPYTTERWNSEMRAYLASIGFGTDYGNE